MTKEEKELLLKDLCARLPYKPIVHAEWDYRDDLPYYKLKHAEADRILEINDFYEIWNVKPYLRPMSSMTDEEKKELSHLLPEGWSVDIDILNYFYFDTDSSIFIEIDEILLIIDWLNSHHFDYHHLIESGLALEAPEGMYKEKIV